MRTLYQKHQFVTDPQGNKIAVIVLVHEYGRMLEELDDLEDIRLYDESRVADSGKCTLISDCMKKRGLEDK